LPSESQLAQAFQVSRPIVREALCGLAILGVVESGRMGIVQ
jgi:DNA-binding FadR family transcriptional regulator